LVIGILEGKADKGLQIRRDEIVFGSDARPIRFTGPYLLLKTARYLRTCLHTERIGNGWPDVGPAVYVAVGDVESLIAGGLDLTSPVHAFRKKLGVDRLAKALRTARIVQRQA